MAEQLLQQGDDFFVQALDSCLSAQNAQVGASDFFEHRDDM